MKATAKRYGTAAFGILAAIWCIAPVAVADEKQISLADLPAPVRTVVLREAGGAKITEIEQEIHHGRTTYEIEWERDAGEFEIEITADGLVVAREAEGAQSNDWILSALPDAARAAVIQVAGGAAIREVEQETENGVTVYEAEWVADGVKYEASVTADGTVIEIEERLASDRIPAVVMAAIGQHFGADAKVVVQKKTIVVYEVEAKIDGKETEIYVFPTGRVHKADDDGDDDRNGDDDNGGDDGDDNGDDDGGADD